MSEGRFGIRYPWRSTSSCCGGCRCSTMEILMRGVCIICAYTGVNCTLPTSCSRVYSRGCYDIEYSFHLRGGRPGVILSTIQGYTIMLPLAADLARPCRKALRTAQRGLRYRPRRALFLPHPDILFHTVFLFSALL